MVSARTNSYGKWVVQDDTAPPPQVVTFECPGRGTLCGELVGGKAPHVRVDEPPEHRGIYFPRMR